MIRFSVLRGVCQAPAYVAYEKGFFADEGLSLTLDVAPTAWMVPDKLASGDSQFAVIPWTRAAAARERDLALVVICGSGHEEAALVVRAGIDISDVRRVTVPLRGGMKDLTAMALVESLGWTDVEVVRQPSGDGAIISLFGQGCDAASMIEPYATMMVRLGVGYVARRTGDVWPGAPGCSLITPASFRDEQPAVVEAVVRAYTRAARFVRDEPGESAAIASGYIGIHQRFVEEALRDRPPDIDAIRNEEAMAQVLELMVKLGYVEDAAQGFVDLSFLDAVALRA